MRRFSLRGRGSRGLFRRYYRFLTNWVTILPSMPWVFGGMDAPMNKVRVRAGLKARRLEAARLLQIGVEPPEVARRLKVSRTSVWRWMQAFAANGRSDRGKRSWRGGALRRAPHYLAPAARLTDAEKKRLVEALEAGALAQGYATDLWTLARGAKLIAKIRSKRYSESGVWRLIKKLNFSCQRPSGCGRQAQPRSCIGRRSVGRHKKTAREKAEPSSSSTSPG
jgi:transposase